MKISYGIPGLAAMVMMSFLSCSNPKEKIVERQKEIKLELVRLEKDLDHELLLKQSYEDSIRNDREKNYTDADFRKMKEKIASGFTDAEKLESEKKVKADAAYIGTKLEPINKLKAEYDSLEMELKKY